jgi:hypothetical protein
MDEFRSRQLAQIRFGIADFRAQKIGLNVLLSRLEGAARAVGQEFWENQMFTTAVELEQINADLVNERRTLNTLEQTQVETYLTTLETQLSLAKYL